MGGDRLSYVTVSIPVAIADDIDGLIGELGYWPSRGAFVREACIEKIRRERERLREIQEATGGTDQSPRGKPRRGTNPGISPRQTAGRKPEHESSPKMKGG